MKIKVYVVEKKIKEVWEPISVPLKNINDVMQLLRQNLYTHKLRIIETVYEDYNLMNNEYQCSKDGHQDPDNTGICIYCATLLKEKLDETMGNKNERSNES
jgi:hypothetical protein